MQNNFKLEIIEKTFKNIKIILNLSMIAIDEKYKKKQTINEQIIRMNQ